MCQKQIEMIEAQVKRLELVRSRIPDPKTNGSDAQILSDVIDNITDALVGLNQLRAAANDLLTAFDDREAVGMERSARLERAVGSIRDAMYVRVRSR